MQAARKHTAVAFVSIALVAALTLAGSAAGIRLPSKRDREAPSAPTNIRVTAATPNSVSLAWDPATDNVGVSGYYVYVDAVRDRISGTQYTATNLACGESVGVWIVAFDYTMRRSPSALATVSTAACPDTQAPTPPSGFQQAATTQDSVILAWNASSDDTGVVAYGVYRNQLPVQSPSQPTVTLTGLACGSTYEHQVDAVDAAGNRSERRSAWVQTARCSDLSTPPLPPPPPPPPPPPGDTPPTDTTPPTQPASLGVGSATRTSVSLTWSASTDNVGVAGYRVYVNGVGVLNPTQPGATVTALTCGTALTLEVDAADAAGNRSTRARVTASTSACVDTQAPTVPTNVVASSRTATSIALTWSASSDNVGVTGYGLYRGGTQTGTSATTTGIFSGLTCNTNYTLAVDAQDAVGNRSGKATVMVATTGCPDTSAPTAPTNLAAANVTQTGLTLNWSASSDNVGVAGYDVYKNGTKVDYVSSTSSAQSGLACATSYLLGVEALDAAGNRSARTQVNGTTAACATPPPPPPPPPPPAPSGGTPISSFSDTSTPWGRNLINRWQPVGGDHWSAPGDSGTSYSSGGGMWEVSTPHGPGFKMVATPEMTVPSGGKMALIADIGNLVKGVGYTEDWSGMVMLPASGNPNGFPRNYPDWQVLWEFHTSGAVPAQMGIDTTESPYRNHLYFKSMGRKVLAPAQIEYDRWYSWRCVVKWSYGSDGLFECWLDGQKLASWSGPTLAAGEEPYLQFGFYSTNSLRNEAWHAQLRKNS